MEKETERISKSLAIVERQIVELKDSGNKTALDILRKKEARLKEELKGTQMTTNALAKNLLAQRKNIKGLSKIEFNDLIRRLSKRPEYSFLKTMPKDQIKNDLQVTAKPVGWRFKGRGNYDKPTAKQIVAGKKSGRVYNERRPLRSDVSQVVKLKDGGNISEKNYYIQNNIGKAKYTISYFDGKTLNNDGSPFYGIKIFKNKVAFMRGIRDFEEQGYKPKYSLEQGGNVDLFQDYNNIPKNVSLILEKNTAEFGDEFGAMDFEDTKKMQKEVEAKGYTFDYDMDGSIYGLRPINVPLNHLEGYEDEYAEGGNIDDYISKNKFLHNPIDEKEVLESATFKVSRIKNGKSSANLESIKEDLNEAKMNLYRLDIGTLKPARIIGTGYRGNTRKMANTWLLKQIAINEKTIELLKEPTANKSTSSSSIELYIKTIAEKTATRPLAVKKFVEYHKLTDTQVLNLMQGIGMGTIKGSDFASAIVGDKVSEKAIVKFAKSSEAFKTPKTITASAIKDASYISNRDIVSLTIKKGSDTITINGNDILDGVYLKNTTTMSAPKESASDIVLKIITKTKELDKKVPFWGNLKEKMTIVTASRVQKLLDAGYDTKEIMLIYLGINSVYDVTIDNEFSYNAISGLFDYEISYIEEAIEDYVELANLNQYELGLKYPELDWSKIIEKYKISKTPKKAFEKKSTRGNEEVRYVYATYQGDDVVVSTSVDRERWISGKKEAKDSYYSKTPITDGNFKNGYWGITSSKKEIIMDILSMIVGQSTNYYVKDIAVFRNNLGGAHAETLIENKIKFEQGGNINNLKVGSKVGFLRPNTGRYEYAEILSINGDDVNMVVRNSKNKNWDNYFTEKLSRIEKFSKMGSEDWSDNRKLMKLKFEQGGNIGRTISFMDWKGNVRKGVITEKLKRGYEVLTSDGVALVEDSEIIE